MSRHLRRCRPPSRALPAALALALVAAFAAGPTSAQESTDTSAPLPAERLQELMCAQFEALNAQELDGYVDFFADDVRVMVFPDQLVVEGREAFRAVYEGTFQAYPELEAWPTTMAVEGRFLMLHEVIRNGPGETGFNQERAIFEFDGETIRNFWFFPMRAAEARDWETLRSPCLG